MTMLARTSLPIALFALLAGCKSNNIKTSEDNDYVSQTVDSRGAHLELDDATVDIPADALAEEHEVRLGRVGSGYPAFEGLVAASPVYSLEPHDLALRLPVTLGIAHVSGSIFLAPEGGMWMDLKGTAPSGNPTAQSTTAGFFAAVQSGQTNAGNGDGKGPNGNMSGDGTLVRAGVGDPGSNFAIGDSYAFYVTTATDAFGAQSTGVFAAALDSMDAPMSLAQVGSAHPGDSNLIALGEYAYWSEMMEPSGAMPMPMTTIRRVKPGGAPEDVASTTGMGGMTAAAGSLLFIDSNKQLTLYDGAAGKVDATNYGTLEGTTGLSFGGGPAFTRSEDHVFYLTGGQTSPYEIWAGPIGSPATDTGMNFPGGAMVLAIGGAGSKLIIVTLAGTQENVIAFDTASPMTPPKTLASVAATAGGGGNQTLVIDGGFAYVALYANGGATGELIKIDLNDGTQTPIGTYLAQGSARPVKVNATNVFVLQPSQAGNAADLYKWAR